MIDLCSQEPKPLLSVEAALARIEAAFRPVAESENVFLKDALGRVLSESVYSPINIPHDRNSAMDGYAFSSQDAHHEQPFTLTLAGTSWAGRPFKGPLPPGYCIRIFTGAVLPDEADSVVMQEQVFVKGQVIHFLAKARLRQNIREIGEDIREGSLLCTAPKKLNAIDLGLLASAGIDKLVVKRPVKIAFFSTGDELTALGLPLVSGQIYDSNRYMLGGLLTDASYCVTDMGVIADNKQLLEERFIDAAKNHDVVITTGGASVGEADYVKEILERCGEVDFWKIAIKPGKPLAFGKIGDCYFFGLPGNPVAVIVTFQHLVVPALKQLSGVSAIKPWQLTATCTSLLKKAPGRQEYQRGILSQDQYGEFFVASSGKQGSNILSSMSQADCYMVLPIECQGVEVGDKVKIELIRNAEII
ncbi:gephyrin-like molybdotransferase Glp [Methylobacter sp. S3L5C]|uniref:molybdopterin molybdotransferase MoeA n=1 Tax=Methylobacter sp. S3L5C TaxID=2839024 RepID=UPI001FAC0456|nr:gephyrin-like molybdotransferase Glp [Methylobacter sp. S3L5C]UOA10580.1 molybdopterin molybdotransferase MoeA [Methylobacter sp. S3L5C]